MASEDSAAPNALPSPQGGELRMLPANVPARKSETEPPSWGDRMAALLADYVSEEEPELTRPQLLDMTKRTEQYVTAGVEERLSGGGEGNEAVVATQSVAESPERATRLQGFRKRISTVSNAVLSRFKSLYQGENAEALVGRLDKISERNAIAKSGVEVKSGHRDERAEGEVYMTTGIHESGFVSSVEGPDQTGRSSANIVIRETVDADGSGEELELPAEMAGEIREALARSLGEDDPDIAFTCGDSKKVHIPGRELLAEYRRLTEQLGKRWEAAYSYNALNDVRERLGLERVSDPFPRSTQAQSQEPGSPEARQLQASASPIAELEDNPGEEPSQSERWKDPVEVRKDLASFLGFPGSLISPQETFVRKFGGVDVFGHLSTVQVQLEQVQREVDENGFVSAKTMKKLEENYGALQGIFPRSTHPYEHLLNEFFPGVDVREEPKVEDQRIKLTDEVNPELTVSDVLAITRARLLEMDAIKPSVPEDGYYGSRLIQRIGQAKNISDVVKQIESIAALRGGTNPEKKGEVFQGMVDAQGLDLNGAKRLAAETAAIMLRDAMNRPQS